MAVTSWTSEGMDWTTLQDKRLYPYAEALRLAIAERATAAGESVAAVLQTAISSGRIPGPGWASAFQSLMTTLIGVYVNHTDNSGNWDGQAIAAPVWTEAGILSAIGASSREVAGDDYAFRAAWAEQQYALLNKLLWTRKTGSITGEQERRQNSLGFASEAAARADATANYPATPTASSSGNCIRHAVNDFGLNVGGQYSATLISRQQKLTVSGLPSGVARDTDWYATALITDAAGSGGDRVNEYDDFGEGITRDVYNLVDSAAGGTATAETSAYIVANTAPSAWPSTSLAPPTTVAAARGFKIDLSTNRPVAVLKWNVTGGLSFLA